MSNEAQPARKRLDIRKYSNRRYYDTSRSCHLTLEEIRDLIRQGHDIRVTDSATSADITAKVLAQIILDLDSPKFDLFPADLLAQMIRANDHLVKGFYERFFGQALGAFLDYQKLVESQLRQGTILPAMFPQFNTLGHVMTNPFSPDAAAAGAPAATSPTISNDPALSATLESLRCQIADLRARVEPAPARKHKAPPGRPRGGSKQSRARRKI